MEHLRQIEANEKMLKKKVGRADEWVPKEPEHGSYLPPYLLINKNALLSAQPTSQKNAQGLFKDAHNERAQRQDEIERRLVGQLGDRFKDAKLMEVSEGSYLIQNRVKLPIRGLPMRLLSRTKANTKTAYLQRLPKSGLFGKNNVQKYVL